MDFLTGIDEEIARAKSLENYVIDKMEHCPNNNDCGNCADFCLQEALDHKLLYEWLEKLKEYVELEEQGLLLRLPCKVGDKVYCFCSTFDFEEAKVNCEIIEEEFELAMLEDFGKTVFLTKEEAEQKLAEMKGE